MANNTVKFTKPYTFEGKEYKELELPGLNTMTVADLIEVQKTLNNRGERAAATIMETSTAFVIEMGVKASGKPIEFFKLMPRARIKEAQAEIIKSLNSNYKEEDMKAHVLRFASPYTYEGQTKAEIAGQTFESIDLSGVGELNAMSESTAENRMTAAGFAAMNTGRNYLYAVIIASMGSGYPEDFFTGLPLCEAVKLRDVVDADFFA